MPNLPYYLFCYTSTPTLDLWKAKRTGKKINPVWKRQCNVCQDAFLVHHTFSWKQSIQVAQGRQFHHTCTFWKQIVITRYLLLLKKAENMTETIYRVGLRGNCIVGKMPPTSLYSPLLSLPFQQNNLCLANLPRHPEPSWSHSHDLIKICFEKLFYQLIPTNV